MFWDDDGDNSNLVLYCIYHMPGTSPSGLYITTLNSNNSNGCNYYSHFIGEETEAQ